MEKASRKRVPYYRKPTNMTIDEWQIALRKQFALDKNNFTVTNVGEHPVYSDFEVHNPESKNTYKVSIRDNETSFNFCSCPDFKINGLGTCKHLEYVLHLLRENEETRGFFNQKLDKRYCSLTVHYGNERKIRLMKADDEIIHPLENTIFDKNGFLKPDKTNRLNGFINEVLANDPGFRVYPDVFEWVQRHDEHENRQGKLDKIFPKGINSEIFNGLIKANLYPYQKEGVTKITRAGRVLLADEMGLGKTIQAIAATEIFARFLKVGKVLIICPTSLKYQWQREIEKFTEKEAMIVEGMRHKRKILYQANSFYKIISYGITRHDHELVNQWGPDLVIIDEAQRIKNWKTQTAQAVKKIISPYCTVLTGTPLENRIDELHSIVEYIDRYKLGPLFRFLHNHQITDESGKLKGYTNLRGINKTLEDILIRRTKKEIADQLPGRTDKNFFVEMTDEQKKDHDDYYTMVCKLVNKWIRTGHLSDEERKKLLSYLSCMRMVANTTYILDQNTNHGYKIGELKELLHELVEEGDCKIVIFSQWKRMFDLVINELEKLNLSYVYLNGDVAAKDRRTLIEKFHAEKGLKVFLSTDAGGVGVNLQCANILINMDLPWNPAVLEQRVGRIYRLGQKKKINVFNFVSRNSIEHRILYLLDFKKSVFTGTIDENGEDTVMLEGFMDSVKSLTEVNFESHGHKKTAISKPAEFKMPGKEEKTGSGNAWEEENLDSTENPSPLPETIHPSGHKTKRENKSFFHKLKSKVKKLFGKLGWGN